MVYQKGLMIWSANDEHRFIKTKKGLAQLKLVKGYVIINSLKIFSLVAGQSLVIKLKYTVSLTSPSSLII